MTGTLLIKRQIISSGVFGIGLPGLVFIPFLLLVSSASIGDNLLDAAMDPTGQPQVKDLDGTNWIIIRKKLSWGESSLFCDKNYYRLAMLPTKDSALEMVKQIEGFSEKFSKDYLSKYKEIEFGMDRRYWIGLTDQMEEGNWHWTHDGSQLAYEFWYPNQPDHKKSDNGKSLEHCVTLWNPGFHEKDNNKHTFNDEDCSGKYYAICDKGISGGPPAAPPP